MPSRDDDAADLKVLRRDSMSARLAAAGGEARPSVVHEAVESGTYAKASRAKPFLIGLGLVGIVLLVVWTIILVVQSLSQTAE